MSTSKDSPITMEDFEIIRLRAELETAQEIWEESLRVIEARRNADVELAQAPDCLPPVE